MSAHGAGERGGSTATASVIIPAHQEERTIGRLLRALTRDARFEIVVAANGCSDGTVAVASEFEVVVLDLPEPGKTAAMWRADAVATAYPRVYLDADIEISAEGVTALVEAVAAPSVAAAGPMRVVPREGAPWFVAWYYDVWEALPAVRAGLFGRGVIALSRSGVERVRALPDAMSDDLAFSEAFAASERVVVPEAVVVVHPPRTWADSVRRRTRVVTGNTQADGAGLRGEGARTGPRTLLRVALRRPRLIARMPVFVAVTLAARLRARRAIRAGDFTTWERDESSRG